MTHNNDNQPAWDSIARIRPSPSELMALLHLRHDGLRPPTRAQLDAAVRLVIRGERWCGRDGRWRPCETYEQPKGSRRAKPIAPNHARRLGGIVEFPNLSVPTVLYPSGPVTDRIAAATVAMRVVTARACSVEGPVIRHPMGAPNCEWLGGTTHPSAGHNFIYRKYGAVEDAIIAAIDASRVPVAANDNAPTGRRRRSRRAVARAA